VKPALCGVCGKSAIESPNGDWVTFSDHKKSASEVIGHPEGLEWFCEEHLDEANLLSGLKSSEALAELRNRYPSIESRAPEQAKDSWFRRLINRNK